jgi:hypothetical protein
MASSSSTVVMLATTIRPKTTGLFRREAKGGGSENASPNKSLGEVFLFHDDECIIQEKKSSDQSSDWSKVSETEETRSEAGYSIPYSHGEYSDAGSSSYAYSEISGPLLVKGNINFMDWNTTTIEMESKADPKDTSFLSSSSSTGTSHYPMPIESSIAMHSASVTTPPVIPEQEEESEENPASNSHVTLIMEEQQEPILKILVSVPKESNKEQVVASPPQVQIPKKFMSVAARLFRARNEFHMEDNPDPTESKEIAYLIKNHQQVSQRLKSLVTSVKTYQEAAHQLQQARGNVSVMEDIATKHKLSPIHLGFSQSFILVIISSCEIAMNCAWILPNRTKSLFLEMATTTAPFGQESK